MNMTCFLSQLLFQSVSQDMWMIHDMFSKSLIIYFHMEQKQLLFHFEYNYNQTSTAFN